jgi:ABC-type glycerol-3-phosphate transport system substrate-binding protein
MADDETTSNPSTDRTFAPSTASPSSGTTTTTPCPSPLQECTMVCPANLTLFQDSLSDCGGGDIVTDGSVVADTILLKFLTADYGDWIKPLAEQFSQDRPDVNVELVIVSLAELSPNIINEARSKTGLFDGFITPPGVMGSIVEENGWADLRSKIESTASSRSDWLDIFLSYRKWISQYQDEILMYPLDGDVLSLFYREDVLDAFGFQKPRTWDEYNHIAAAVHGKIYKNHTLTGSCIGRLKGCAGAYWANLVLSSMTQYRGTWEGHLFDSADMTPLLGEAFEKMLELMETQARYGAENEFEDCVDLNSDYMNNGTCVLSYSKLWQHLTLFV